MDQSDTVARRRLGYVLEKPNGRVDTKILKHDLDPTAIDCLNAAVRIAYELQPILSVFDIVNLALHELHAALDDMATYLSSQVGSFVNAATYGHDTSILLQHRVMAFLSANRSFLDHAQTDLTRRHGADSPQMRAFRENAGRLYDNKFSYRFLYQLRNASQHVVLPISGHKFDTRTLEADGQREAKIALVMDRTKLLQSWQDWKPSLKSELEQGPSSFDLLPLLNEQTTWLHHLTCVCFVFNAKEIVSCNNYLENLCRRLNPPPDAVPVIWKGESSQPGLPPERLELLPFREMQRINEIWKTRPNIPYGPGS
jgi:hypothetical protein